MCDEAVDDSLAALKFIPDYFVLHVKLKNFILFYIQMITYCIY